MLILTPEVYAALRVRLETLLDCLPEAHPAVMDVAEALDLLDGALAGTRALAVPVAPEARGVH